MKYIEYYDVKVLLLNSMTQSLQAKPIIQILMYAPLASTSFIKQPVIEQTIFKRISLGIAFRTC